MLYGYLVRAGDEGCACGIGGPGSEGEHSGKGKNEELHSRIESKAALQRERGDPGRV